MRYEPERLPLLLRIGSKAGAFLVWLAKPLVESDRRLFQIIGGLLLIPGIALSGASSDVPIGFDLPRDIHPEDQND